MSTEDSQQSRQPFWLNAPLVSSWSSRGLLALAKVGYSTGLGGLEAAFDSGSTITMLTTYNEP